MAVVIDYHSSSFHEYFKVWKRVNAFLLKIRLTFHEPHFSAYDEIEDTNMAVLDGELGSF